VGRKEEMHNPHKPYHVSSTSCTDLCCLDMSHFVLLKTKSFARVFLNGRHAGPFCLFLRWIDSESIPERQGRNTVTSYTKLLLRVYSLMVFKLFWVPQKASNK